MPSSDDIEIIEESRPSRSGPGQWKRNDKTEPEFFANIKRIWGGRVGLRTTLTLTFSFLVLQFAIIGMNIWLGASNQDKVALEKLLHEAKSISTVLAPSLGQAPNPLPEPILRVLLSQTPVTGISVYTREFQQVQVGGEPIITKVGPGQNYEKIYRSPSMLHYEVVYDPADLFGRPYYLVMRIKADEKATSPFAFVAPAAAFSLATSIIMSLLLVGLLYGWFVKPFAFLRRNLVRAARSPENPIIETSPFDGTDEIGQTVSMVQDLIRQNAKNIHQIKNAAQTQIHKLAYFDTLTGLPNRTLFVREMDRLTRLSEEKTGRKERFGVATLDLDHFKDVNDSMGHQVGDAILKAVAKRLRTSLPHAAVVARSGEDEFAVSMPLFGNITSARALGDWLLTIMRSSPIEVFNESFQIRGSVGVATFPDNGSEPEKVLRNADIALNRAKEEGRDTLREYLPDFDQAVQQRFQMLRDLRTALEQNQLSLFYQPQLSLHTGKVIGAEALLRWWFPDPSEPGGGRFISPAQFIPVAEQSGLIVPIGEWVMRTAFNMQRQLQAAGINIRMAINVSGHQFYKADLVKMTQEMLKEFNVPPESIELEVTESIFMDDIQEAIETLNRLHNLGVELAIDDFGTGYSSLSYLRQFPVDRLKIDQSFIRNALTNKEDAAIARAIIRMSHSLDLQVIAEGVETKEHEEFLKTEQCDEVQGYRYSKPVTDVDFRKFMSAYTDDLSFFDKKN